MPDQLIPPEDAATPQHTKNNNAASGDMEAA